MHSRTPKYMRQHLLRQACGRGHIHILHILVFSPSTMSPREDEAPLRRRSIAREVRARAAYIPCRYPTSSFASSPKQSLHP